MEEISESTLYMLFAFVAICVVAIIVSAAKYIKRSKGRPNLTKFEMWCVRLSCFLSVLNGNYENTLTVWPYTGKNSGQLKRSWGISNRDDFEKLMNEYKSGDRCRRYDGYVELIMNNSGLSDEEIAAKEQCNAKKLGFVRETCSKLSKNSILAFDYGTYAYLTRVAFSEGMLTKEEALENLRAAGALVKEKFSSWDEFGYSYYAGAVFAWADSPKSVKRYQQVLEQCKYGFNKTPFAWKDEV